MSWVLHWAHSLHRWRQTRGGAGELLGEALGVVDGTPWAEPLGVEHWHHCWSRWAGDRPPQTSTSGPTLGGSTERQGQNRARQLGSVGENSGDSWLHHWESCWARRWEHSAAGPDWESAGSVALGRCSARHWDAGVQHWGAWLSSTGTLGTSLGDALSTRLGDSLGPSLGTQGTSLGPLRTPPLGPALGRVPGAGLLLGEPLGQSSEWNWKYR
jgi:hypothetical protein